VIVAILLIQNLLQEKLRLGFEITHHLVVIRRTDQLLEVVEDGHAAARVVRVLSILEVLNLHEELKELVEALDYINVDLEQGLERPVTLRELVHRNEVDRIASLDVVLLSQDLSVPRNDIAGVLLEEGHEAQVELSVPLDRICIMLDRLD